MNAKTIFVCGFFAVMLAFVFTSCEGPMGGQGTPGGQGLQGESGSQGGQGSQGETPYIGSNGNWWIGDTDTGIKAQGPQGEGYPVIEHPGLVGIKISQVPYRTTYLMGEQVDVTGLQVTAAFSDGTVEQTSNYSIVSDTFTAGSALVNVISRQDSAITSSFTIEVLNTLVDTGLPVIYIDTQDAQEITSRENYVKMNIKVVSDDPGCSIINTDFNDEIRGRGNSTWGQPKKPYRIRFSKNTSLFDLPSARNWVLLANHLDYTLLKNTIAFELGKRFGMEFTNNYIHVELVLNGNYQGSYILTEHIEINSGRIDINRNNGYLVEMNRRYLEEEESDPYYLTSNLNIPFVMKFPDVSIAPSFVKESLDELDTVLSADNFPENNYADIIDLNSLIDFLIIKSEIALECDFRSYLSVFLYRDTGQKIKIGPLWDFDLAFGSWWLIWSVDPSTSRKTVDRGLFERFYTDPVFLTRYKERWNEKYNDILDMWAFINTMQNKVRASAQLNARRWSVNYNYDYEVEKLKTWYMDRVPWLNSEINNWSLPAISETQRLMIFQVYGTGTDTDGAVSHSFVELYNNSDEAIDLSSYSLHYANGHRSNEAGPVDSWTRLDLSGTISAGSSYLIIGEKKNLSGRYQIDEANADLVLNFILSNRAFKVALMSNLNNISAANPFNTNGYVDMVSVINSGDIIDAYEGAAAEVISKQAAARRGSLIDSDNNQNDFVRIDYRSSGINDTQLEKFMPRNMNDGSWIPQF